MNDIVYDEANPHLGGNIKGIDPHTYCPEVFDYIIDRFKPKSVFDVGCGEGHLLKYFYDKDIACLGSEGLKENYDNIHPEIQPCVNFIDYTKESGEGLGVGVSISCEFVEHVHPCFIPNYLPHLCSGKIVIFTHAQPRQEGHHHVNCRNDRYWIELMEAFDMVFLLKETLKIREIGENTHWSNTLVFRNEKHP